MEDNLDSSLRFGINYIKQKVEGNLAKNLSGCHAKAVSPPGGARV